MVVAGGVGSVDGVDCVGGVMYDVVVVGGIGCDGGRCGNTFQLNK